MLAALAVLAIFAGACGADDEASNPGATGDVGSKLTGALNVFSAASLTEAFTEMGKSFEAKNPGVDVTFNFGASNALVEQVNQGAPADVLATADEANMAKASAAGNVANRKVFVRNRLAIMVAKGNPKKLQGLADLARPGVVFVMCAPTVPCGRFGAEALNKAGVRAQPRSQEESVKGVVSKVTFGEADAGIVYVSDIRAVGDKAEGVVIPDQHNVIATYPIASLTKAQSPQLAQAWVDFVLSEEGQAILFRFGFQRM
jgi:molybdate transport system substrate-binding protein